METFIRIIKYFLLLCAFIFLAFSLIGVFIPKVEYGNECEINRPIELVFEEYMDERNLKEWLPGFVSSEVIEETENLIGSKAEMIFYQNEQKIEMLQTVVDYKENTYFEFELENDLMHSRVRVDFSSDGSTTTIKTHNVMRGRNFFAKSIFPLWKNNFKAMEAENYNKLIAFIEKKHP